MDVWVLRCGMQAVPAGGEGLVDPWPLLRADADSLESERLQTVFVSHHRNEPPHVHIERGGAGAKFWLEQVIVARNDGFAARELGDMVRLVRERRDELLEAWHDHFRPE